MPWKTDKIVTGFVCRSIFKYFHKFYSKYVCRSLILDLHIRCCDEPQTRSGRSPLQWTALFYHNNFYQRPCFWQRFLWGILLGHTFARLTLRKLCARSLHALCKLCACSVHAPCMLCANSMHTLCTPCAHSVLVLCTSHARSLKSPCLCRARPMLTT